MIPIKAQAIIVAGLGFGDEGKGTITDYLVREYIAKWVIRYNGGPQAAHNAIDPTGRHHCFSQFGAGSLMPGVTTYLSGFALADPLAIRLEADALKDIGETDALSRLHIDEKCLIVTPFHKHVNRMQEVSRGKQRHGSCGKGIGQAVADGRLLGERALKAGDLRDSDLLAKKLRFLWLLKLDLAQQLVAEQPANYQLQDYLKYLEQPDYAERLVEAYESFYRQSGIKIVGEGYLASQAIPDTTLVFEGAQGALLDANRGFWPHVTQSNTSFENAIKLAQAASCEIKRLGVLRAYATRHGAGPFVSEEMKLTARLPELHNRQDEWQGNFRVGWFDLVATRYALESGGGADSLAITCLDRLYGLGKLQVATAYSCDNAAKEDLDRYFDWEGAGKQATIHRIKTDLPTDQASRLGLTRLLSRCKPVYVDLYPIPRQELGSKMPPPAAIEYLLFLEKALKVPIEIVSVGPGANEKFKFKPCVS